MASPFGLAYGIGAGLAEAPGYARKATLDSQTIAMNNMRMQQAQREMQDEENARLVSMREMATPPPAQLTVDPSGVLQPQAPASGIEGNAAFVGPAAPMGTPQQRPIQPRKIEVIRPMELDAAQKQMEKAQELRAMGSWKTADMWENNAHELHEKGVSSIRLAFSDAFEADNEDGLLSALHSLGQKDIVSARQTPNGGLLLVKANGDTHEMDTDSVEKLRDPKAKTYAAWTRSQEQKESLEAKAKQQASALAAKAIENEKDRTNRIDVANIKKAQAMLSGNPGATKGRTYAAIETMKYLMAMRQKHLGENEDQSFRAIQDEKKKGALTDGQLLGALVKLRESTPKGPARVELEEKIAGMTYKRPAASGDTNTDKAPPPPPSPGPDYKLQTAGSGAATKYRWVKR